VKYAWIKGHTTEFPVDTMCRFLGVSRSAYSIWLQRPQTSAEQADAELTDRIQNLFKASRATYGTRRIKTALLNQDQIVSRRRIGRLMRAADLACKTKRKFKATTNSKHDLPIAPNHRTSPTKPMSAISPISTPRRLAVLSGRHRSVFPASDRLVNGRAYAY
jgi:transposase InsO family protein